jgi:hypothetical protein
MGNREGVSVSSKGDVSQLISLSRNDITFNIEVITENFAFRGCLKSYG